MEDEAAVLGKNIDDMRKELREAKELRDSLNLEAKKWAEERNRVNESFKALISRIAGLKARRKAVNERVLALRVSLEENRQKHREKKVQFQILNNKLKDFKVKGLFMNSQELEDKIGKIDWRIQTTPLTIEKEKMLTDQVKRLESQLVIHKGMGKLKDEMRSLRDSLNAAHQEISELSDQRRKLHEDILDASEKAYELKSEADKMHRKYLEYKDGAHKVHLRYVEILSQSKDLQQQLDKIEEDKKARRGLELESNLEKRALEKMKSRKKLTFNEFKILAEKGRI